MKLLELLEVSALVASHARSLACDQPQVAEQAVVDYWVASRCRFDSWGHDLRAYGVAASKSEHRPLTPRLFRLAVEIETSEVLARTLAALGYAHDTQHHRHETSPITTNVLAGQRDATKRMTALIAGRDESAFRDVVRFRNLRTRLHHLTDHLVACFLPFAQVAPFAHNPRDIEQLGTLAASRVARGGESCDWPTLSGMLASLGHECSDDGSNDHENHQVAASAMGLFAPEMFDSFGLLRSTWLRRLERTEGETTVLIDEWLATEAQPNPTTVNRIVNS
ncbi:hypothetical protein [Aeoliella sp. SH292]|uniref:hypothetical protein n=1 Tax=Aeoliella sp. SH292 TaxID=3454464 RepID=UPI003F98DE64